MREALQVFTELETPGVIQQLPFRWSEDETWRDHPMNVSQEATRDRSRTDSDIRQARSATPQYQSPEDEEAARLQHTQGACGACVGAE